MKKFIIVTLMAGFLTTQAPVKALTTPNYEALAQAAAAQRIAKMPGNKTENFAALKKICTKTSALRKLVYTAAAASGIAGVTYLAFILGITPDYLMSLVTPESFNTLANYWGTTPGNLMSYMPESLSGYLTPVCDVGSALNSTSNTCQQIVCKAGQKLIGNTCQNICPDGYFGFVADKCYEISKECPELCSTVSNGIGIITEKGSCLFKGSKALGVDAPTLLDTVRTGFWGAFGYLPEAH
jgi:hypothetical protein